MMTIDERLARLRKSYKRLLQLLDSDDRSELVCAEITHTAAHLAEHAEAMDRSLSAAGALPDAWTWKFRAST